MTIVCAYRPPGSSSVWMASDSRTTGGNFIFPERSRKLHRVGGWLLGASGPDCIHEIVKKLGDNLDQAAELRDAIMAGLKTGGWETERQDRGGDPPAFGMAVLAARPGELFGIAPDGCIWEPDWGFAAIGSGQDFAYGAAWSLKGGLVGPASLVTDAVRAAIAFHCGCGGDVVVESIG